MNEKIWITERSGSAARVGDEDGVEAKPTPVARTTAETSRMMSGRPRKRVGKKIMRKQVVKSGSFGVRSGYRVPSVGKQAFLRPASLEILAGHRGLGTVQSR